MALCYTIPVKLLIILSNLKIERGIMENQLKKYNSIDMMRLLCAIMVVAIHTQPFMEYKNIAGYFATYIFPRLGVPFFFAVSGYFYLNSLMAGKKVFVKYVKRLMTIYIIWSFIYYMVDLIQALRYHNSLKDLVKRSIINFFMYGSHYHLWFFPTLIFCVVVTTILRKHLTALTIVSYLFYGAGCMVGAYYGLGSRLPFINVLFHSDQLEIIRRNLFMGLPFFLLGYVLSIINPKLSKVNSNTLVCAYIITAIFYLSEIFILGALRLQTNIVITVFLYPLLALAMLLCFRFPLPHLDTHAKFCKISANFMYYSHPLFMFVFAKAFTRLFSFKLSNTPMFLLVCIAAVITSLIIFKINNRYLNKLVQ